MKKLVTLLIFLVVLVTTTNTATREKETVKAEMDYYWEQLTERVELQKIKRDKLMGLKKFLEHLALKESANNPTIVNSYGYIGKYQFGKAALEEVGLDSITVNKFKDNPNVFPEELQDKAVVELMKINKRRIGRLIKQYEGTVINGIVVTEAGILGAAHLAGAGGVKKFLKSNGKYNPQDGYGTRLTKYLKEFKEHTLNLEYA